MFKNRPKRTASHTCATAVISVSKTHGGKVLLFTFHPEAGGRHRLISISMTLNNDGGRGRGHTDWAVRSHLALLVKGRGEKFFHKACLLIFNDTQAHWLVLLTSTTGVLF